MTGGSVGVVRGGSDSSIVTSATRSSRNGAKSLSKVATIPPRPSAMRRELILCATAQAEQARESVMLPAHAGALCTRWLQVRNGVERPAGFRATRRDGRRRDGRCDRADSQVTRAAVAILV